MLQAEDEEAPYGVAPPPPRPPSPPTYAYACVLCALGTLQRIVPFVLLMWGIITMTLTFRSVPHCARALRPWVGIALSCLGACSLIEMQSSTSWVQEMRRAPRTRRSLAPLSAPVSAAVFSTGFLATVCPPQVGLQAWCWSFVAYLYLVPALLAVVRYYAQ